MTGWSSRNVSDLIKVTEEIADRRDRQRRIVDDLRATGCPWSIIADALGVSKQAAHRRFSPTMRNGVPIDPDQLTIED